MPNPSRYWDTEERRRFPRLGRGVPVACRLVGQAATEVQTQTQELGAGGIRIRSGIKLPVGSKMEIMVGGERHAVDFSLPAILRWCRPAIVGNKYELGMQFTDVTEEQSRSILRLIGQPPKDAVLEERRGYVRLHRPFALWYKTALFDPWKPGDGRDLSCGGMMFATRAALAKGMRLKLMLELSEDTLIRTTARIVEVERATPVQPARVHVSFGRLLGETRRQIGDHICREIGVVGGGRR